MVKRARETTLHQEVASPGSTEEREREGEREGVRGFWSKLLLD